MKLLFVHERFGALAGAEVNIFLTAAELKRRGHTVALLHGAPTGREENRWRELFPDRYTLSAQTAAAVAEFRPDIIYVHKLADLGALEVLVNCGRPLVRMIHDHDLYCMRSYKYHPLTRQICTRAASPACIFPCGAVLARNRDGGFPLRWISYRAKQKELRLNRQFQRMIVATHYMQDELVRNRFDPAKIEIHAPVPRALENVTPSSFSDRNLIIYSGQIIRGKGVDVLLASLAQLRTPFECLLFGDGSHRPACEKLCRQLGLDDRVHFKGFVPQDELQSYYADASLAVMSSVWPEPFGAAGLEAMRHGLPVVAFDAGGIREWLGNGHNGLLAPWMDRAGFAKRIEQLLTNKTRARQMGENGRQLLHKKYDFGPYLNNLEKMFTTVITEARTKTPPKPAVYSEAIPLSPQRGEDRGEG